MTVTVPARFDFLAVKAALCYLAIDTDFNSQSYQSRPPKNRQDPEVVIGEACSAELTHPETSLLIIWVIIFCITFFRPVLVIGLQVKIAVQSPMETQRPWYTGSIRPLGGRERSSILFGRQFFFSFVRLVIKSTTENLSAHAFFFLSFFFLT